MFTDSVTLSEQGAWVHLKDKRRLAYLPGPDGRPDESKPCRIKVLGPDSPTLQEKAQKRTAKRIKSLGGSVNIEKMSEGEIAAMIATTAEDLPETWADATIAWENMPENIQFSRAAAVEIYKKYPAIVRQLVAEAGDPDDFIDLAEAS